MEAVLATERGKSVVLILSLFIVFSLFFTAGNAARLMHHHHGHHDNSSANHNTSSPPVNHNTSSPPVHPPVGGVSDNTSSPPANHNTSSPPANHNSSSPPANHNTSYPPVHPPVGGVSDFPPEKFPNNSSCDSTFNVQSYGAVGDGVTDDTEAFQLAWKAACQVDSAVLEVPQGYSFMIQSTIFSGPCKSDFTFQVDGTLLAPDGPENWAKNSSKLQWIVFYKLQQFTLQGQGLIDGNGENWWNLPCKPHRGPNGTTLPGPCESPTTLRFFDSIGLTFRELRIRNSPQFHVRFDGCKSVLVDSIIIDSPQLSPNTDGIHVSNTQSVGIYNSVISNGDDCISIVSGVSNVDISNITCKHSHGISIGGLGNHNSQACVSNINVSNVLIKNSDNGLRIKTWQGGLGAVSDITFDNVYVENVRNPIIIDQFYCFTKGCHNKTEAVYVSNIAYTDIRGTYDVRAPPMHFACSDTIPCTNITLANIELYPAQGQMMENPFCWNAYGTIQTLTVPPITCLQEGNPQSTIHASADSCF